MIQTFANRWDLNVAWDYFLILFTSNFIHTRTCNTFYKKHHHLSYGNRFIVHYIKQLILYFFGSNSSKRIYHFLHDQYLAFVLIRDYLIMSCSKTSSGRIWVLNFHIRITKVYFFYVLCLGSLTYTLNFFTSPRMICLALTLRPCILLRLQFHLHCTTCHHSLNKKSSPSYVSSIAVSSASVK